MMRDFATLSDFSASCNSLSLIVFIPGIIFVSPKYLVGFFGNPQMIDVAELEKVLQTLSSKPLKLMKKDKVTKGKGK